MPISQEFEELLNGVQTKNKSQSFLKSDDELGIKESRIKHGMSGLIEGVTALPKMGVKSIGKGIGEFKEAITGDGTPLERITDVGGGLRDVGTGGIETVIGLTPIGAGIGGALGLGLGIFKPEVESTIKKMSETQAGKTVQEIYNEMNDDEKSNVEAVINLIGLKGLKVAGPKGEIQQWKNIISKTGDVVGNVKKTTGEVIEKGKEEFQSIFGQKKKVDIGDLTPEQIAKQEAKEIKGLGLETVKGQIDGIEVDIPVREKGIIKTVGDKFGIIESDPNKLINVALKPSRAGIKSPKVKLNKIKDITASTKELYKKIRTGELEGDISTLEDTAQTVVDNLDVVGKRIGGAVSKLEGGLQVSDDLLKQGDEAIKAKGAIQSDATNVLRDFLKEIDGPLTYQEAFDLKVSYSTRLTEIIKKGGGSTKQARVLADGIEFLNKSIDDAVELKLGNEFAKDKATYRMLKNISNDLVNSSIVEGRQAPQTFVERIAMIQNVFNPVEAVTKGIIKELDDVNTRGGAWKRLIEIWDNEAINSKPKKLTPTTKEFKTSVELPEGTKIPEKFKGVGTAEKSLIEEARKFDSPYRKAITNIKGNWDLSKIKNELKGFVGSSEFTKLDFNKAVSKFDNVDELADNVFYHGTATSIPKGLKPSIALPKDSFRGAGRDEDFYVISLSQSKNIASRFTGGTARTGTVYPVVLKKGAKIKSIPNIKDANELEDILPQLWDEGIDAVKIGDWNDPFSEKEISILNPRSIVKGEGESFQVFQKKKFENLTKSQLIDIYNQAHLSK